MLSMHVHLCDLAFPRFQKHHAIPDGSMMCVRELLQCTWLLFKIGCLLLCVGKCLYQVLQHLLYDELKMETKLLHLGHAVAK